jgi:hypothetical protein
MARAWSWTGRGPFKRGLSMTMQQAALMRMIPSVLAVIPDTLEIQLSDHADAQGTFTVFTFYNGSKKIGDFSLYNNGRYALKVVLENAISKL